MKKNILTLIVVFLVSIGAQAQIDRSIQPKPGPAPKIKLGKPQSFNLKNGLRVMVVENHKLPRVSASLSLDNGPIFEGEKAGVMSLLSSLLGSGSKNISKDDFNEKVDFLGAQIYFGSQSANMSSLSKYFPTVLDLMADAAKNPVFTQEEFDTEVTKLVEGLKMGENSVGEIANRVQGVLTYGKKHPYGEFATETSVKNVQLSDVQHFYDTYFVPNNAYLVIIGDVNFKKVKKLVKKQFGNWKKGTVPNYTMPSVSNVAQTEINFINMPNAVQSDVSVISTTHLTMNNPDYYAVLLANQILGGDFDSYLNMNLREKNGYTYGARSRLSTSRHTVAKFKARTTVRNTVTDSTVVEIMKEINNIRTIDVSAEKLKAVKSGYVGKFVMALERPSTLARYALNIETNKLPSNYYKNYLANINKVTVADIKRVAQKYFTTEKARIVITGKAIDVLPNLEKTGYTIRYFDKQGNSTDKPEMTKPIPAGITKKTVINSYFDAIGGKDKVAAITSTLTVYETEMNGSKVSVTEKRTATHYLASTAMNGATMMKVTAHDGGVFMNGQAMPSEMANELKVLGTFIEFYLLNNENSTLSAIEMIDGKEAYVIKTTGEIVNTSIYYDTKTGLKLKEVQAISMGGRTQNQEATYSEYKTFNGIKFATKKTGSMGPQKMTFTLSEAKINEGVSDADFK